MKVVKNTKSSSSFFHSELPCLIKIMVRILGVGTRNAGRRNETRPGAEPGAEAAESADELEEKRKAKTMAPPSPSPSVPHFALLLNTFGAPSEAVTLTQAFNRRLGPPLTHFPLSSTLEPGRRRKKSPLTRRSRPAQPPVLSVSSKITHTANRTVGERVKLPPINHHRLLNLSNRPV